MTDSLTRIGGELARFHRAEAEKEGFCRFRPTCRCLVAVLLLKIGRERGGSPRSEFPMSPFVRRPTVRHADRLLARSVLLLVVSVYVLTVAATPSIEVHDWSLDPAAWRQRPSDALSALPFLGLGHAILWFNEASPPEPLLATVLNARGALFGAWTAWLVVLVARRLGARRGAAWITGLAYAFTTFAWPAARSASAESLATLLLFSGFHHILRIREGYDRLRDPSRWLFTGLGLVLAAAAGVGLAFLPTALGLLLVALVVIARGHRRLGTTRWAPDRRAGGFALDLSLVVVPFVAGVALVLSGATDWSAALLWPGERALPALAALLLAPGFGLLFMAPVLWLLPWAWASARRGGETLWLATLVLSGITLLLPAMADVARREPLGYGPLPILPWLPLLFAGLARLERPPRWMVVGAGLAALFGLLQQLPATLLAPNLGTVLASESHRETAQVVDPSHPLDDAWDLRLAAPGVLWRVLRREVAVGDGRFPLDEVFLQHPDSGVLEYTGATWDLGLMGPSSPAGPAAPGGQWWAILAVAVLAWLGVLMAFQGLDPAAP